MKFAVGPIRETCFVKKKKLIFFFYKRATVSMYSIYIQVYTHIKCTVYLYINLSPFKMLLLNKYIIPYIYR